MKSRTDLLYFYTQYLGFANIQQLTHLFQKDINIEHYLFQKNPVQKQAVKLMLFKHYLMQEAIVKKLLTKEQAKHLMDLKTWEIKNHTPPLSFLIFEINLISEEFLKMLLLKFNKANLFKLDEFKELLKSTLCLPESYMEMLKGLYEKPKIKINLSKIREDGEILCKYEINCECGNFMIFEVEENSKMRMYCNSCRQLVLNLKKKKLIFKEGKTLNELAPDLVKKINRKAKQFDYFKLIKKIGEGASGKVYLAKNERTGENVALKILLEPEKKQQLDYFKREIKMLSKLVHPNIVTLKTWGSFENKPYLAMEYVEGQTLLEMITANKNGISIRHAIKIFVAILSALEYAQTQNFIHRDIKPANIIISNNGVKLIDLGIAKVLESSLALTQSGQIMGTPYYISPEQIKDSKRVDHRADIFSLGASLFHALCGQAPFQEHTQGTMKLLLNKSRDIYIRLGKKKPDLPISIIQIVEKSMALKVTDRYQSATEMKTALSLLYKKNIK